MQIKKRLQINVAISLLTAIAVGLVLFLSLHRLSKAINFARIATDLTISALERVSLKNEYINNNNVRAKDQWLAWNDRTNKLLKSALGNWGDIEDKKTIARLIVKHESVGRIFSAIVANREKSRLNPGSVDLSREAEARLLAQLNIRLEETVLACSDIQASSRKARVSALKLVVEGVTLSLLLIITSVLINSWMVGWAITDRISRLSDGATKIGDGDLDHRIDIKGDDELAKLSVDFNRMAGNLSRMYNNLANEIQARRLAEAKLLQSEEQYRTLFNSMIEGFCIIELLFDADDRPINYRFQEINPAFEALTGLRNAQGKLVRELLPENEAYLFDIYGKVALTGKPARFVNEVKELNRWYDVGAYRLGGRESRKIAIIFNDITEVKRAEAELSKSHTELEMRIQERTAELSRVNQELEAEAVERKRTEQELREKETRLRFALDSIKAGEWDLNLIDLTAYRSPQHDQIFGYQDLLPIWTYEMFVNHVLPADRAEVDRKFHHAIEEHHNWDFECRIVRCDGEQRWIRACGRHQLDELGTPYKMIGIVEDITERKQAEKEREQFFAFFKASSDLMCIAEPNGAFKKTNPAFTESLGYSEAELVSKPFIDLIHTDDKQQTLDEMKRQLAIGNSLKTESRCICKDGSLRWLSLRAIYNKDDHVIYATARDITERKQMEDALQESEQKYRQLNETLEERIKVAVEELRDKNRMLIIQGRQAIMGEMIGNISHQWRQPLNMLGLLAQELQVTCKQGKPSAEYIDTNIKKTLETIRQMSQTIDDFRNFFQIDRVEVNFDVYSIIEKTISLLEIGLKSRGIRCEIEKTDDISISGYPNEFAQVLLNIVNNARDAFIERNIINPAIVIRLYTDGGRTIVTICDNAGGIPAGVIDKVFEPYFTTKGPDKGTGIGLFMSKSIIEGHMNGSLSVRNAGDGAEFRIEI